MRAVSSGNTIIVYGFSYLEASTVKMQMRITGGQTTGTSVNSIEIYAYYDGTSYTCLVADGTFASFSF